MTAFTTNVTAIVSTHDPDRGNKIDALVACAQLHNYTVEDIDKTKPWGGYVTFAHKDADTFIAEFFPDINPIDARLGNPDAELSPKFLLVAPEQRLSWQVHERRTERWVFLTEGGYYKSLDADNPGELRIAAPGHEVQFTAGECHRLVGGKDGFTLVAEIWQHTDPANPSDESDITRLDDDYQR